MSLRGRLLVATGVAVLLGLVIVSTITYTLLTRSQLDQADDALRRAHGPLEQLAAGGPDGWDVIPRIAPGLFVAIVTPSGETVFSAPAQEAGGDPVTVDVTAVDLGRANQTVASDDGDGDEDRVRLRVDPIDGGGTLIVGQSLHDIDETNDRLRWTLFLASGAALAGVVGLAWWLIGIGLAPLRRVEAGAAAITDDALGDARVPGDDRPTEVGRLARTLNAMLDRLGAARAEREETMAELQASEARMRRFVADASHELRTPIAATAAYAELFESGARDRPDDLARSMKGVRTETARMADLVEDLLLLARLDEQRPLAAVPVDLTDIVLSAVDAASAVAPDRRIRPRIDGIVMVEGDPIRLRQVVDNLLANVRAHTPPDTPCEVVLTTDRDRVRLTVADQGPGVSAEALTRLADRFYRVDDARTRATGGSGLGLAIARAIVEAHGGTLAFASNEPSGLAVTVELPVLASAAED